MCSWIFPALPFGIRIKLLWPSLPSYGSPTWGISFQASLISLSPVNLNEYDLTSGIARVNDRFQSFFLSCLIHKQIHAVWVPTARTCANSDYRAVKTFSVNALATDVTLLLIMLAGLIRLRLRDRTFIDLAYVLWKQVGHCSCWLRCCQLTAFDIFRVSFGSSLPPPQNSRKW